MTASRTLELYGFVKGDFNLIKDGLRVKVLDVNLNDCTDLSETYLVRSTSSGFIYKVKAKGDLFFDTPTDTKTGLYDGESFYIVFEEVGVDTIGKPARQPNGDLFTYEFRSSHDNAVNIDLYLDYFSFEPNLSPGNYVDRPTVKINSNESGSSFLITFNGELPKAGEVGVVEVLEGEPFVISRDGEVVMKVVGVDKFGNSTISQSYIYNIEYPNVLVLEPITLREINTKRFFYSEAFLLEEDGRYLRVSQEDLDALISEAESDEVLDDLYYVPLEPGINDGVIFASRFVRLASNRSGVIRYQIVRNNIPETSSLINYDNSIIDLSPKSVVILVEFTDLNGTSTGTRIRTYKPVGKGPVIEQVSINDGETEVYDSEIIVNVLTKGGTPQVITIGQNPILFPVDDENPVIWEGKWRRDCQYNCGYGYGYGLQFIPNDGYGYGYTGECSADNLKFEYGYGYDRKAYETNFCFNETEECCTTIVHTAFNERTPFKLCEQSGEQCIYVRARNYDGSGLPIVKLCVTLDLDVPLLDVDPVCTEIKRTDNKVQLSGTKGVGDAIWINGQQVVAPDDTVVWSYWVRLSSGTNQFTIFSRNEKGRNSESVVIIINYEFVFTGVPSAIVRADGEGNWEVIGLSLNTDACEEPAQVWEILAEIPDPSGVVSALARNVYVVENGLEVNFVSPQHQAPVCETTQKIEFSLTNPSPLNFYGPYQAVADEEGNWFIDGIALEPALFTDSTDPNMEIIAYTIDEDQIKHLSTTSMHVQVVERVELQLDGVVLGRDYTPPFTEVNCLTVSGLLSGLHTVTLIINDYEGFSTRESKSFIVDTQEPVVEILSPTDGEGIYTIEPPLLEYRYSLPTYIANENGEVKTIPLIRSSVFIDGVDVGTIASGQRLPSLSNGTHIIRIEIETITRDETRISEHLCDGYGYGYDGYGYGYDGYGYDGYGELPKFCHIAYDEIEIEYIRPIDVQFGEIESSQLNIGHNIDKQLQAEAIFDELRILNRASTDSEILNDWRLLLNGIRFQNTSGDLGLTSEQLSVASQKELDLDRVSLPDQTLVLMHFDNSDQSEPGIDNRVTQPNGTVIEEGRIVLDSAVFGGIRIESDDAPLDLKREGNIIIDERSAVNALAIDVFVKKGEPVDEDLVLDAINRIIPARGEALVEFVEVEE